MITRRGLIASMIALLVPKKKSSQWATGGYVSDGDYLVGEYSHSFSFPVPVVFSTPRTSLAINDVMHVTNDGIAVRYYVNGEQMSADEFEERTAMRSQMENALIMFDFEKRS